MRRRESKWDAEKQNEFQQGECLWRKKSNWKKRDSKKQIEFRQSKMNCNKMKWDPTKQSDAARQMSRSHEKKQIKKKTTVIMQWNEWGYFDCS